MTVEALYGVEFVSNLGYTGHGVLVLETGRVLGGDSSFVFIGDYKVENQTLSATVRCTNDRGTLSSIFGDIKEFTIDLSGRVSDQEFILSGHLLEDSTKTVRVTLTRRAELP